MLRTVLLASLVLLSACVTQNTGGPDAGVSCLVGTESDKLLACLDSGKSPNDCLGTLAAPLCDADWDGLGDDLEIALAKAYAPVFAFNGGDDAPYDPGVGNHETNWPGNVRDFVKNSRLKYRPDGTDGVVVNENPTLDTIAEASGSLDGGTVVKASGVARNEGPDFWICMKDYTSPQQRLNNLSDMLALTNGVDVAYVAHPANGRFGMTDHILVFYMLFFPYNEFAIADDHEGDWEYVATFINRKTGAVEYGYFGRHPTKDNKQLISVAQYGAKNPAADVQNDTSVEDQTGADGRHGLRFWDFGGLKRHLVAYPSTGGHAMYDYPGNTRTAVDIPIIGAPRDTHDGRAEKFVTWKGYITGTWGATTGQTFKVNFVNLGEAARYGQSWLRFRGQWGCDVGLGPLGASWSPPFGNARWARPEHSRAWGNPPVQPAAPKADGGT